MAALPAIGPNPGYIVSITRKFIMPSTITIKNAPSCQIGNISYMYNRGKFDKKITLKPIDFLVISQKETLQWDNIADISTSKKGKQCTMCDTNCLLM